MRMPSAPPHEAPSVEEYRLALDVDASAGTWTGTNEFDVRPAPEALELNSAGLELVEVRVDGELVTATLDPPAEQVRVPLGRARSIAKIYVRFRGAVEPRAMIGLYYSRSGENRFLTSQCAATGARRIFPCIDRPDRKARFLLTVSADAGEEVISNTVATVLEMPNKRRRWSFAPTPPMATYLFYLGIGKFERIADRSGTTAISVVTGPGRSSSGRFALGIAVRALRFYEQYYEIPYPLPKLDLLAIGELPWGAMENWGAITFQEMQLLVDERTGELDRRLVCFTVAHELAHQWFGDLVTMRGWEDVWLNESFATLVGYTAVDRIDPSGEPWDDFRSRWTGRGLSSDSLCSAPAVAPRGSPSEAAGDVYDPSITYGKGASVLRMLETYLGEETFRRGVVRYLRAHANGNAATADLWTALSETSGEAIADIAGPWIERPGHPVLEAHLTPGRLEVAQRRFLFAPRTEATLWPIPLRMRRDEKIERFLFDIERRTIPGATDGLIHLNPEAGGFYRVRYDRELYDRLRHSFSRLSAADRWSVLVDLYAFVMSGDVPFEEYAEFVRRIDEDPEPSLVDLVRGEVSTWVEWAYDVPCVTDLARSFLATQFERIGPRAAPGEARETRLVRERLAGARARVDEGFARQVAELFVDWERIDPEMQESVAIGRGRTDPRLARHELRRRLGQHPPDGEAFRLAKGLVWMSDPAEVTRFLDEALAGGAIGRGHIPALVIEAARNPVARDATWQWLSRRGEDLDTSFRGSAFLAETMRLVIPPLGLRHPDAVRAYFSEHRFPEGKRGIDQGLETLTIAEEFRGRLGASVPLR